MKNILIILLFCISLSAIGQKSSTVSKPSIHCHIKGKVVERPQSNMLYLTKVGGDSRIDKIEIPIKDGLFEYELICNENEMYEFAFKDEIMKGSWRPIYFFVEDGIIDMELFPEERFDENVIKGGVLNKEYCSFKQEKDSIFDYKKLEKARDELPNGGLTDEMAALYSNLNRAKDDNEKDSIRQIAKKIRESDNELTTEAKELKSKYKKMSDDANKWELEYAGKNVSLIGYYLILNKMIWARQGQANILDYISLYEDVYAKKYPNHSYTERINILANAYTSIKVGEKYIDFTAPDFSGKEVTLSDQIGGKLALIDLWASWCGPCRRLSISMIPVYEKYKDKGFVIVGVAREEKAEYAVNAATKDKYPWLNLVELKDKGQIWRRYGIGNAGGSTFLVDKNGSILAIHPTAEEVEKILIEKLK